MEFLAGEHITVKASSDELTDFAIMGAFHHYLDDNLGDTLPHGAVVRMEYLWGYVERNGDHTEVYDLELTLSGSTLVVDVLPMLWKMYMAAMDSCKGAPRGSYGYEGIVMKDPGVYRVQLGT